MLLSTGDASTDEFEPVMHKTRLPPIKSITITRNGARSPAAGDLPDRCEQFLLSKHEVTEYLRKAGAVTKRDYLHLLDWSPCFASGKVTFENGVTGTWGIQQLQAGSLKLSNGRTLYLYCPKCRAKSFLPDEQ
jgi:hypothetical protein